MQELFGDGDGAARAGLGAGRARNAEATDEMAVGDRRELGREALEVVGAVALLAVQELELGLHRRIGFVVDRTAHFAYLAVDAPGENKTKESGDEGMYSEEEEMRTKKNTSEQRYARTLTYIRSLQVYDEIHSTKTPVGIQGKNKKRRKKKETRTASRGASRGP